MSWFLSGGDAPNCTATGEDRTDWADENRSRSGTGAFLILLAGFALLHFAGTIRRIRGRAETAARGCVRLARVAFAGCRCWRRGQRGSHRDGWRCVQRVRALE